MKSRAAGVRHDATCISDHDVYLFREGSHYHMHEKMGSHITSRDGETGVLFSVWAPNAAGVSVMGSFNRWNKTSHQLRSRNDGSGIWEGFVPGVEKGTCYKYHILSHYNGYTVDKGDPFARYWEIAPKTASVVWDNSYRWNDGTWMTGRASRNALDAPLSVYEVHLGSWRRVPEENNRLLTYRELAPLLTDYILDMGFTHVEFLPLMEHPFYASWGYQVLGYFAPTSRYGTPEDFMFLVDQLHQHGIGVILDWVPSHFPNNENGLVYFDGTNLYEHADPRQGFHPDWKTYIFNHDRYEVRSFLLSNAMFWLEKFHIDGLRVDAVASMLYLDYSRDEGEWIPNYYGGRENLGAIYFLRRFNEISCEVFPDTVSIAEESTAWPMVTRPTHVGGLGFGLKWNMGWMHDVLDYMKYDPVYRKYHHNQLTFSMLYAFTENFMLSLSHDEVVHGKGSLIGKMPGFDHEKFANLRLLLGYLFMHPGKKLLFMGGEFGQWNEWNHDASLDWHLLDFEPHRGLQRWVRDLNMLYRSEPALHELDCEESGFQWIDCGDWEKSILSFTRRGNEAGNSVLVVCNFTPVARNNYRLGAPEAGLWLEILNSDAVCYGGTGTGNCGGAETNPVLFHGYDNSLSITLPPLSVLVMKHETGETSF